MSVMTFKDKINVLSTLAAGTFAGGTLMIGVTFGLLWGDLSPDELVSAFPHDWKNIATTIVPVALLQTFLIPLSLYLAWKNKCARRLWMTTLGLWVANCTITSVYHLPVVLNGLEGVYTAADISDVIDRWLLLHWLRVLLGFGAVLYAMSATMKSYKEGKEKYET